MLSLNCLDNKRLGKQRVEAMQILQALEPNSTSRWRNHPAVKMWRGYEDALHLYKDIAIAIWIKRGFKNTMVMTFEIGAVCANPPWLTDDFCNAHRSNLLRKDFTFYSKYNWDVSTDLPYIWPVS